MTVTSKTAGTRASQPRVLAFGNKGLLAYALACYLGMLAVLGYGAGFFANRGVPTSIDGGAWARWPGAAVIDLALLGLFAVQHTVIARSAFKRRWTRLVPAAAERATFVLAASLALALLYWQWRPFGPGLWRLAGPGADALLALQAAGWLLALGSTFLISHTDLFGLRQAWRRARGSRYTPPPFTERGCYRWVRHPLMLGFLIVFWATPVLTAGHLLFCVAATGYILAGIGFEERDLRRQLGAAYASYAARVPALIPGWRPRRGGKLSDPPGTMRLCRCRTGSPPPARSPPTRRAG
jgi:protein-S-isoprenylcysteine O-methyltransferase Ste14